jgi:membrane-associated HD superfamily phosphohydrolase
MELIITYLIEKGGMFGVLLAISFAWIVFREKQLFNKNPPKKEIVESQAKPEVDKILYIVEDIKKKQEEASLLLNALGPIVEQIHDLEKTEITSIEKLGTQITGIDSKISEVEKKTQDLWDWHAVKDSEGVPLWYVRRSLEESIGKLETSVGNLQLNITQVNEALRTDLEERLQKVNDERVLELKRLLETYNKTVTDLILALEKIKFLLKSDEKAGE